MSGDDNRRMNPISPLEGVARLVDWGVIRARGADAASFLQGQLSNDVARLGASQARLAGYCSVSGVRAAIAWNRGLTTGQASGLPPGMMEGPFRAPSSPPLTPTRQPTRA